MSSNKKDLARDAEAHKRYVEARPTNLTAAPTYCNASMKGLYSAPVMASPRADANDHMSYASRDSGAMIVRV